MGKVLILLVFAASVGGMVTMQQNQLVRLSSTSNQALDETTLLAREAAQSGFNVGHGRLMQNATYRSSTTGMTVGGGGTYDLTVADIALTATPHDPRNGLVRVTSTGRMGGEAYQMTEDWVRVAPTGAALIMDARQSASTYSGSAFTISGQDQRPLSITGGTTVRGPRRSQHGILATSGTVFIESSSVLTSAQRLRVSGIDGTHDVEQGDVDALDLQALYNEVRQHPNRVEYAAGYTFTGGSSSSGGQPQVFGSRLNPAIVIVNGDAALNAPTWNQRTKGVGILLIDGNMTSSLGHFEWEGIVFINRPTRTSGTLADLSATFKGDARVYGSVIMRSADAYAVEMPVRGRLRITFESADAGLVSGFFVKDSQGNQEVFHANRGITGNTVVYDKVYNEGQRLNFFARVYGNNRFSDGTPTGGNYVFSNAAWRVIYDHYAVGHHFEKAGHAQNGRPYALVDAIEPGSPDAFLLDPRAVAAWRVKIEDLKGDQGTDWDYNDIVARVEVIPEVGTVLAAPLVWNSGVLRTTIAGNARIQYSSEAVGLLATKLETIRAIATLAPMDSRSAPVTHHEARQY